MSALHRPTSRAPSRRLRYAALPLLAFLIISGAVAAIAHSARQAQIDRLGVETRVTAEQVRRRLEAWIDARLGLISLMGGRWQSTYRDDPEAFRDEATRLLELYPGLQALNWIDADWVIRQVVPRAGNEPALNKDLHGHPDPEVRAALQRAGQSGTTTRTGVISLLQGGRGFAIYHAVCTPDACPAGFVNGVFRIDRLVDSCLAEPRLRSQFDMELFDDRGRAVHRSHGPEDAEAHDLAANVDVRIVDRPWTLRLAPTASHVAESHSVVPGIVLVAGMVLGAVIAGLLWLLIARHHELGASELRYRTLFGAAGDAILLVLDGRFVDCNETACRLFDRRREEIIGSTPWDLSPPTQLDSEPSKPAALRQLARARSSAPISFEWVHQRPDGTLVEVEVTLTDLSLFGERHLLAVLRDVSSRKQIAREKQALHERMMQAQKLESLGVLAGGIAHDFNNIVQIIRGNAELSLQRLGRPDQARSSLREVDKACRRAAELCSQLLAYSGRGRFEVRLLDLGEVVREMAAMLEVAVPKKVGLCLDVSPDLPAVEADAAQMQQVVMNLITNAAESYGGRAGRVDVTVDTVVITAPIAVASYREPPPAEGSYVRVTVRDAGRGMSAATRRRVFEPFFTTKFTGHGLGLAAVLGIVHAHRGAIRLVSALDVGTTFEVLLPAVAGRPARPRGPTPTPMQRPSAPGVILLADDEEGVIMLGREVLEELGYEVLSAADGREALDLFRDHIDRIDCAILDLTMPYLSGDEVYRELRKRRPALPVVICSGHEQGEAACLWSDDPRAVFLQKPYILSELTAAIAIVSEPPPPPRSTPRNGGSSRRG